MFGSDTGHWGGTTWGHGIDVALHSDNITVESCSVYNTYGGICVIAYNDLPPPGYPDNVVIRNNFIYDSLPGIATVPGNGGGATGTGRFYNNILRNCGIQVGEGDYHSSSQIFINNSIYFDTANQYGLYMIGPGSTHSDGIIFNNNIISAAPFPNIKDEFQTLLLHSHNLLYRSAGTLVNHGSTQYNLSNINAWEPTVQTGDPLFQ